MKFLSNRRTSFWTAGLLLATFPGTVQAQTTDLPTPHQPAPAQTIPAQKAPATGTAPQAKPARSSDQRRAIKLYLAASKLFVAENFEEAMRGYEQAAKLDPANANYPLAAEVARNHAVTALIQASAKDRMRGDAAAARATLAHALELSPKNELVAEHLHELGNDALLGQQQSLYEQGARAAGEADTLAPAAGTHSFHLHTSQRQILQQVFKAYGIETTLDDSVRATQARLDIDNVGFEQAARTVSLLTKSFYETLDAHRVLVANDTRDNRQQFLRNELETIYLPGLTAAEMTDIDNLAKNVFDAPHSMDPSAGTITLRAPEATLNAFNATLRELIDGHSQVLLEMRLIQLAHSNERNTGAQLPQQITAFNVYAEEQSLLNANSALVQQIISSGLASAGDIPAIIGILLASGQVSSSLFSGGIATFGGGITKSALSPGSFSANLSLNSSESRQLDNVQMRLGDGEEGKLRLGQKYPIQTSSYSNMESSGTNIPGLTAAGVSSQLSSLLSSLTSSASTIPMVEYQDLGLTLKATPKVMRNNEVALSLDLKIDALAGTSINGVPTLNNRAYSGVVTLRQDEGVVIVSELDKQESRDISGTPGISEIPGLNDATGKDTTKSYATLVIVITPHVIRGPQPAGHTQMMRVERSQQSH
jgi:Flp pilus assembly secretin CpaC